MTSLNKHTLRRLLHAILITESEFEAFCIDHFPQVQGRFTSGMDRIARTNVLFEIAPLNSILDALENSHSKEKINSSLSDINNQNSKLHDDLIDELYAEKERRICNGEGGFAIDEKIKNLKRQKRELLTIAPGTILNGRYRLFNQIGQGGFGTVWRAFDKKQLLFVAVKILHRQFTPNSDQWIRFARGARAQCHLGMHHQNIVQILSDGVCQDNGILYYVMQYMRMGDLRHNVIERTITPGMIHCALIDISRAINEAHLRGIIHRDIKPHNILLDENGRAGLTDFDLVLSTDTTGGTRTSALGTVVYSAPETLENASKVDIRADIYSMGMVCIFSMGRSDLTLQSIKDPDSIVSKLEISEFLKRVLLKSIAWSPVDRYSTMYEFHRELCTAFGGQSSIARHSPLKIQAQKSRRPINSIAAASAVAGILVSSDPMILNSESSGCSSISMLKQESLENAAMILIPSATVLLGSNVTNPKINPEHRAIIRSFKIDRTEVSVAAYEKCVSSGACTPPDVGGACNWSRPEKVNHPINCVDWVQASSYCQWLNKRLPTEDEWEYAARGSDGREYPWGNDLPEGRICWKRAVTGGTCEIGQYQTGNSPFGLVDMSGNVWEWTSSYYEHSCVGKLNCSETRRSVRGGSWFNAGAQFLQSTFRTDAEPSEKPFFVGFRCAEDT